MITEQEIFALHTEAYPYIINDLFNQQLWLWGQDILNEGNLLIRYGFDLQKPHDPSDKGRRYSLPLHTDTHVHLFAGGVVFEDISMGQARLERSSFIPDFSPHPLDTSIFSLYDLPGYRMPESREESEFVVDALHKVTDFIKDYEAWVHEVASDEHKKRRINSWEERTSYSYQSHPTWERMYDHLTLIFSR